VHTANDHSNYDSPGRKTHRQEKQIGARSRNQLRKSGGDPKTSTENGKKTHRERLVVQIKSRTMRGGQISDKKK
jgi:hypothetical protein